MILCCCSCWVVIKVITQVVISILAIRASFHNVTYRNMKHVMMLPTETSEDYELIKAKHRFPASSNKTRTRIQPATWQVVMVRLQSERMRNCSKRLATFKAFKPQVPDFHYLLIRPGNKAKSPPPGSCACVAVWLSTSPLFTVIWVNIQHQFTSAKMSQKTELIK